MPGLGDSKWASKPTEHTPTQAPTNNSNRTGTDKHVTVPPFGYTAPDTSTSKPTSSQSTVKPLSRADFAGKTAAKRMDELLDGSYAHRPSPVTSNMYGKPIFYQEHGHREILQPCSSSNPATPPAHDAHNTAKADSVERTRLYSLFRQWVPRAEEFYSTHDSLGLSDDEVAAVQKEIVAYRVQTAIAASKHTTYTAPWETSYSFIDHSKYAPQPTTSDTRQIEDHEKANAMEVDPSDPFGLGLVSSPVSKGKARSTDVMDLMD